MSGAHIGHNCTIGNNVIIANNCLLGGYVRVDDGAFLGGGSTFHQFMRIGRLVMVQGSSGFGKDLPPFVVAAERRDAFTDEPDRLWRSVLRRQTGDLALLSTFPDDPSQN